MSVRGPRPGVVGLADVEAGGPGKLEFPLRRPPAGFVARVDGIRKAEQGRNKSVGFLRMQDGPKAVRGVGLSRLLRHDASAVQSINSAMCSRLGGRRHGIDQLRFGERFAQQLNQDLHGFGRARQAGLPASCPP